MRRLLLLVALALLAAGCGAGKAVKPVPQEVVGTVPSLPASTAQTTTAASTGGTAGGAADGKSVYASNGCGGCHTYAPAGSTQKIGPDLDKLAQYARQAKKPLDAFVRESIVNPSAYVQPGYPNVMPKTYKSLPKPQLDALVKFLTK